MFSFWRKKRDQEFADKEAEIAAIYEKTRKKQEETAKQISKVNKLIKDNPGGIAELLYYATGANRRNK